MRITYLTPVYVGLRGAIAFALALNLHEYVVVGIFSEDNYHYVVTTTLVIVLFTIRLYSYFLISDVHVVCH